MHLRRSGNSISECYGSHLCRRTAYPAVCILLSLFFIFTAGCSGIGTPKTNWENADFTCHAVFSPYEADFTREQGTFTMVLTQPENLSGLTIVCTPDGKYTLSCGTTVIPLSNNLAKELGDFPGVLSGLSGTVELDKEGYPCVMYTTSGGNDRTVQLTNFSLIPPNSQEDSPNT